MLFKFKDVTTEFIKEFVDFSKHSQPIAADNKVLCVKKKICIYFGQLNN